MMTTRFASRLAESAEPTLQGGRTMRYGYSDDDLLRRSFGGIDSDDDDSLRESFHAIAYGDSV